MTAPSDAPSGPLSGSAAASAWREFCDLLVEAGAVLARTDLGLTDFDRAEGLRYLGRLTQNGLLAHLENPGPRHPRFMSLPSHCGFGLDNPDNIYSSAGIDPRFDYRIRGTRGAIAYLSLAAQNQNYAATKQITGGAGHLQADELAPDGDGAFEIIASARPQPGNWLRLAEDSSMILVRQTFTDRATEVAAELSIECIGVDEPTPVIEASAVANQLLGAGMYAIGAASWFADWVAPWRAEPNRFHFPDPEQHRRLGGDPNIVFQLGYWTLGPDEALVIEVAPPPCAYWNIQLGNIWAECLDKRRSISVNSTDARLEGDGSCRIIVARHDPRADGVGALNWLDTAGHDHGIMGIRWVLADGHPAASTTVVPGDLVRADPG